MRDSFAPAQSYGEYTITQESYKRVYLMETLPLACLEKMHWDEIIGPDDRLHPDREYYCEREAKHRFVFFTVREATGALIGYLKYQLYTDPRRVTKIMAQEDGWFLHPKSRKARLAMVLLHFAERQLEAAGVDEVLMSAYHGTRADKLVSLLGYEPTFSVYRKQLKVEI